MGVIKVSISVPADLLRFVDDAVRRGAGSRSEFIARILRERAEAEERRLMIEGYQEMAEENRRLAEEHLQAAAEVWPDANQAR